MSHYVEIVTTSISLFVLLPCKALCVARLRLSGSIVVYPASLYIIGFELIQ